MGGKPRVVKGSTTRGLFSVLGLIALALLVVGVSGCQRGGTTPVASPSAAGATPTTTVATAVAAEATATVASTPEAQQASATPTTTTTGDGVAAIVDGQPIYLVDYQKQVAQWQLAFVTQNPDLSDEEKQEMLDEGRSQVLDVLIEQALIEQAAAREGVTLSDTEVESAIARDIQDNGGQTQFDSWLQQNNWTFDEYKAMQRSMMISSQMFERVTQNVPTQAEQVHARHILVATEDEARALLSQLQGGADFAELARQNSLDPSTKESGGDLGFFPRDTLVVPEVEEIAFALPVGQISDVIKSPLGYHILEVLERVQDKALTEESWQALKEATFRRWVKELWEAADIKILLSF
jgi:peptidyl-prolyl cis-trans isomerase C